MKTQLTYICIFLYCIMLSSCNISSNLHRINSTLEIIARKDL